MKITPPIKVAAHGRSGPTRRIPWYCRRALNQARADIWALPEELQVLLLRGLHIKDLLNIRSAHPRFRDLIDSHSTIWTNVRFDDAWPIPPNMGHFERAAEAGNIAALVKLGLAYLYNEGLPGNFRGKKITSNGEQAAKLFCRVEGLTPQVAPFTWLFIRPPWATAGACCKECVFKCMRQQVEEVSTQTNDASVHVCLARMLQLLEDEQRQAEGIEHLQRAASCGSNHAAYLHWQTKYSNMMHDRGLELSGIRELRDIAASGEINGVLELCDLYAQGRYGGIPAHQAASFVREFIQSSKPTGIQAIFTNLELTHPMRYILIDWLVEVAGMKDLSTLTLHVAISVVDRFLLIHSTSRCRLQLLGVAAMVLCSRFLGKDIITIREAAWLTDNTYRYEDVVRMMAEITATLRGDFRVLISLDYTRLIGHLAQCDPVTQSLAEYISELSLLQSDLGSYDQAEIGASAVLLARLSQKKEFPWPSHMVELTGFTSKELTACTLALHGKCFLMGSVMDHRDVVLHAVKTRYEDEKLNNASTIEIISRADLLMQLSVADATCRVRGVDHCHAATQNLIMSPSRQRRPTVQVCCPLPLDREQSATPTVDILEASYDDVSRITDKHDQTMSDQIEASCDGFNVSSLSGYDADKEDADESRLDTEGYDIYPDLESLWCGDNNTPMMIARRRNATTSSDTENSSESDCSHSEIFSPPSSPVMPPSDLAIHLPCYENCFSTPSNLVLPSFHDLEQSTSGYHHVWNSNYVFRDAHQSANSFFRDSEFDFSFRLPTHSESETPTLHSIAPIDARSHGLSPRVSLLPRQQSSTSPAVSDHSAARQHSRQPLQTLNIGPQAECNRTRSSTKPHTVSSPDDPSFSGVPLL